MPRRPQGPTPIASLIGQSEIGRPTDRVDRDTWTRAVGERIAARTQPERIKDGVLLVRVASPVWAQELSLLSTTIIERLRASGVAAASLRFYTSKIDEAASSPARRTHVAPRAAIPEALQHRLDKIDDPELRRAIAEAAALSLGRKTAATSKKRAPRAPESAGRESAPRDQRPRPQRGARRRNDGKY